MKKEFTLGDIVRLRSGGPSMTVESITYGFNRIDGIFFPKLKEDLNKIVYLKCIWFDDTSHVHSEYFAPETLM